MGTIIHTPTGLIHRMGDDDNTPQQVALRREAAKREAPTRRVGLYARIVKLGRRCRLSTALVAREFELTPDSASNALRYLESRGRLLRLGKATTRNQGQRTGRMPILWRAV
jgi:hypothetical protein